MTLKEILGGLRYWWTRSECANALYRLMERGVVETFPGPVVAYFALTNSRDPGNAA